MPEAVIVHSNVTLACQYDLEKVSTVSSRKQVHLINLYLKASLYSVRWYFETEEFYRYVPTETPPGRTFYVPGILVDVSDTHIYESGVLIEINITLVR